MRSSAGYFSLLAAGRHAPSIVSPLRSENRRAWLIETYTSFDGRAGSPACARTRSPRRAGRGAPHLHELAGVGLLLGALQVAVARARARGPGRAGGGCSGGWRGRIGAPPPWGRGPRRRLDAAFRASEGLGRRRRRSPSTVAAADASSLGLVACGAVAVRARRRRGSAAAGLGAAVARAGRRRRRRGSRR